jgi:hypothetical protein
MDKDQMMNSLMKAGQYLGVRPEAMSDFLRRGLEQFPGDAPLEHVGAWTQGLRSAAPHLFTQPRPRSRQPAAPIWEEPAGRGPAARLTRDRRKAPPRERPQPIELTSAQQAELGKLPPTTRLTRYRQIQATQPR